MPTLPAPGAAQAPRPRPAPPAQGYVLIPDALVADLADNLAAIGLYALVGRRFLICQAPVPLSASDVARYDPATSPAAAGRALRRLAQLGWLLEASARGQKSRYTPTWGIVSGAPRPWALGEPRLGLPRRHHALRLDRRLLDLYLGRLDPHPQHPAEVARYLTDPPLGLSDVGAYARALSGRPASSPALARLGLVSDGRALALPGDDEALARASQLTLDTDAADSTALSEHGLRRLGLAPAAPAPIGQALFFVPAGVIGGDNGYVIGGVIGQDAARQGAQAPSGRGKTPVATSAKRSPATPGTSGTTSDLPPQRPRATQAAGGGAADDCSPTGETSAETRNEQPSRQSPAASAVQESEAADLLRSLGVRPAAAKELADAPIDAVRAAALDAARPSVRDRAAWVVAALRAARDRGWQLAPAAVPEAPAPAPAALPGELAALEVAALLARAEAEQVAPAPAPEGDSACACDGSGVYLLDVPYGHVLWGKPQPCPCRHRAAVASALARDASPALAASDLAALRVADRPYAAVCWGGRAFTPTEQAATLQHAAGLATATSDRGLTLVGPPGSGKTTIAVAAARELATRQGLQARYVSMPQLCDALRREAGEHAPAALLEKLIQVPVLILDDLGREHLTPFVREKLYRLLDERMRRHAPDSPRVTFVTANRTLAELYALDGALASRIAAHTDVALCVASDYRLHRACAPEGAAR